MGFPSTCPAKITSPLPVPFTIDYLFESKAHVYLPDAIGQLLDGRLFLAEAGLEQDKRRERNRVKAEAARKVIEQQGGVYWIGTEATLSKTRHANLVFLHYGGNTPVPVVCSQRISKAAR